MNGYNDGSIMGGFGMGFGWIIPVLFIGAIFYFLNSSKSENKSNSANDILDTRFANGDITEEEYKAKKELLNK